MFVKATGVGMLGNALAQSTTSASCQKEERKRVREKKSAERGKFGYRIVSAGVDDGRNHQILVRIPDNRISNRSPLLFLLVSSSFSSPLLSFSRFFSVRCFLFRLRLLTAEEWSCRCSADDCWSSQSQTSQTDPYEHWVKQKSLLTSNKDRSIFLTIVCSGSCSGHSFQRGSAPDREVQGTKVINHDVTASFSSQSLTSLMLRIFSQPAR